jgi:predicted dinucleotide-binding enzyme
MGAGNVGGGLGAAFVAVGHVVVVGVRAPESEKTKAAIASRPGAIATSFAFNTIGFENLTTARTRLVPAAMFVAGDDPDAKRVAMDSRTRSWVRPISRLNLDLRDRGPDPIGVGRT